MRELLSPALKPGITVFIPIYNEEAILAASVERVLQHLHSVNAPFELILGSNGSTDGTIAVGTKLTLEYPEVRFFHLPKRGPGLAFAEALRRARFAYFVCLDADLSVGPAFIGQAVIGLEDHDAVVGSKQMGRQTRSLVRILGSESYIALSNLLLRMPYRDYSMCAKAYRTERIRPFINKLDRHTFYTQQLLYEISRSRGRIAEVPVVCEDSRRSRFNLLHEGFYRYSKILGLWLRSLHGRRPCGRD